MVVTTGANINQVSIFWVFTQQPWTMIGALYMVIQFLLRRSFMITLRLVVSSIAANRMGVRVLELEIIGVAGRRKGKSTGMVEQGKGRVELVERTREEIHHLD
jgi:membrane-bound metal-dependent hydrolase YbcI (DUF457 family)